MSNEYIPKSLRAELDKDMSEKFDMVKEKIGSKSDSEIMRYMIKYVFDHEVLGNIYPPMKITGKDIIIEFGGKKIEEKSTPPE